MTGRAPYVPQYRLLTDAEIEAEYDREQDELLMLENMDDEDPPWTDADEAGLEEYEIRRRQRIAEAGEY